MLIIDDEPHIRQMMRLTLVYSGRTSGVKDTVRPTAAWPCETCRARTSRRPCRGKGASGYFDRWNGTLVTTIFFRNNSAPLMSSDVWLCSRCCHQRAGTNSGRITVT